MKPYQVTGSAVQVGPGEQLVLHPDQVASRKHQVKVLENLSEDAVRVESTALLTFKVGEMIGLKEIPKHAREQLIDLQAAQEAARMAAENPVPEPAQRQVRHNRKR